MINIMIEKKEKGDNVKDLRIINLMEVDFNYSNKLLARETMKCTELNRLLPQE